MIYEDGYTTVYGELTGLTRASDTWVEIDDRYGEKTLQVSREEFESLHEEAPDFWTENE